MIWKALISEAMSLTLEGEGEVFGEGEVEVVVGRVKGGVAHGGDDVGTDEVHELQTTLLALGGGELGVDGGCKRKGGAVSTSGSIGRIR